MNTKRIAVVSAAAAVAIAAGAARASQVTLPNTFTANTAASASQVNANFTAVKTAVDDNATKIGTLQTSVTTLQGKKLVCTLRQAAVAINLPLAGHNDNPTGDVYCALGESPVSAVAWGGQAVVDQVFPIQNGSYLGLRAWYFNLAGGAHAITPQVMCCAVQ